MLLLRSLEFGGAERQACLLAVELRKRGHDVSLCTFYPGGTLGARLEDCGVRRHNFGKSGRWDLVGFFWRVLSHVRLERPDVLYSFMPTANLIAALIKLAVSDLCVIWGIRSAYMRLSQYDLATGAAYMAERLLSGVPDRIVANSTSGRRQYADILQQEGRVDFVPNGVDTSHFRPDPDLRSRVRAQLGVSKERKLVGIVARIDPMKDHVTFLRAAQLMLRTRQDLVFAIVGDGDRNLADRLRSDAIELGIEGNLLWRQATPEIHGIYNALDLLVLSSSSGEGFPNVLAEAQACGVACVATDVGEARFVIGDDQCVVPPGNPEALSAAALAALRADHHLPARRDARAARMNTEFGAAGLAERIEAIMMATLLPPGTGPFRDK